MDDWARFCKALKKELPKEHSRELQDKFNSLETVLNTLDFEEVDGMPTQLSKEEQRIWILQKISDIYYPKSREIYTQNIT